MNPSPSLPRWIAALAFVLACVVPSPGFSQEPAAAPATEEEKAKAAAKAAEVEQEVVEEVITVTDRKREESLQEVPF